MALEALRGKRIAVLMGGQSGEREVSLRSGQGVLEALQRQGFDAVPVDPGPDLIAQLREAGAEVAFNMLHGGAGEDGSVAGALEVAGLPYTGSGVLASAISMDKLQSKRIFEALDIPTPAYLYLDASADPEAGAVEVERQLGLPVVAKPRSEGSSLGVSIPKTREELQEAIGELLAAYGGALIEDFVAGTEITVGIVGAAAKTRALPVLELVTRREFYDYDAKYVKGLTELIAPARIPDDQAAQAQRIALQAHHALGCEGLSRVDMHLDSAGRCWVHEVNSVPGMTETSDVPAAAAAEGTRYDDLVLQILESAAARLQAGG